MFLLGNYNFSRFQRGSNIFRGGGGGEGVQLFPGGGGCRSANFIETYPNWDFPDRGSWPPITPLDPHMFCIHLSLRPSNRSTSVVCVRAWRDSTKFSQASPVLQHCVLEQDTFILQHRKTRPDVIERLLTGT